DGREPWRRAGRLPRRAHRDDFVHRRRTGDSALQGVDDRRRPRTQGSAGRGGSGRGQGPRQAGAARDRCAGRIRRRRGAIEGEDSARPRPGHGCAVTENRGRKPAMSRLRALLGPFLAVVLPLALIAPAACKKEESDSDKSEKAEEKDKKKKADDDDDDDKA